VELPIWGFIAVTLQLVATPGASTAVVLRNSLDGGTRAGLFTALGCNAGSVLYGVLTAFGFAAALQQWPSAWLVLRVAGIGYLAWLGLASLGRAMRGADGRTINAAPCERDAWHSLSSGFITNFFNPSLAAFYLVVIPQFIPRDAPFARSALILTTFHVAMAASWHSGWAVAGSTMARVLSSGRPRRALDAIAGIALVALALKVALD
jgi:threonine/homoserine/homoserine lactone efflux protein